MVLVLGATGFIGHAVVKYFLDQKIKIKVLLRKKHFNTFDKNLNLETMYGNILNESLMDIVFRDVEVVIHAASKNVDDDGTGFDFNIHVTSLICKYCIKYKIKKLFYISTAGVYGHGVHQNTLESGLIEPDTPFSISKAEAEKIILQSLSPNKIEIIIIRNRFIYGCGDKFFIPSLIKYANLCPFWVGLKETYISIIYIEDLVKILYNLFLKKQTSTNHETISPLILNINDGLPISYKTLVRTICLYTQCKKRYITLPRFALYYPIYLKEVLLRQDPERIKGLFTSKKISMLTTNSYFSNQKLVELVPNFVFTPFQQGLQESLNYYIKPIRLL